MHLLNKKNFSLVGMGISILVVLFGILIMAGAMGGNASYSSGSYLYDSGYASFGADFYTYVSNNAAEAASASRTAASNLVSIAKLLKNVCGIFLMGFGTMGFCLFGMAFVDAKAQDPVEESVSTVAPETESESQECTPSEEI